MTRQTGGDCGDLSRTRLSFDISTGQVVRWLKGGLMSKFGSALRMSKSLAAHNVKTEDEKIFIEINAGSDKEGYLCG